MKPANKQGWLSRRTTLIQIALVGFLAGLLLARFGWVTHWHYVLATVILCVIVLRGARLSWLVLLVTALQLGLWRGQGALASFIPLTELIGQDVTLVGVLADDPGVANRRQTEFELVELRQIESGGVRELVGRIVVRGFVFTTLSRGDVVEVSGKVYPTLGNRQAQISFAEIEVLAHNESGLEKLRLEFFAGNRTALPEPQASLGLGFLVGLRALLPDQLIANLNATGLTHIVAVSGYNLTVLVRLMRRLLAGKSKYLATAASVGLILGFLAVTGISPSIFRAAVVSGLSLAAWYYGKPITPMMVLLLAAAVTAGIDPTYLWQDIGWYLSFLAFFGVLVLAPTLSARLFKKPEGRPDKQPPALLQLVIETLCAQIMALPLIMLIFGELSLISLPANVIILPFIPLAMLLSLVAGLAGMLLPALVGWFAWPANLLLSAMVQLVEWLAQLPGASTELFLSPWQLSGIYVAILLAYLALRRQVKGKLDPYYTVID